MAIYSEVTDKQVFIVINERLDRWSTKAFKDAYLGTPPSYTYFLDVRQVTAIDSAGLGLLLQSREYAGADRANITLVCCQENISRTLYAAHFQHLFCIT